MLDPIDKEQNDRIVWCERLLYVLCAAQFPQLMALM